MSLPEESPGVQAPLRAGTQTKSPTGDHAGGRWRFHTVFYLRARTWDRVHAISEVDGGVGVGMGLATIGQQRPRHGQGQGWMAPGAFAKRTEEPLIGLMEPPYLVISYLGCGMIK